jgi:predicted transcriptional regulator
MDSSGYRIERLLVAILLHSMKGESLKEKATLLSIVGFSNVEIADFLQTSSQAVAQYIYEKRKAKSAKVSRSRKKK